LKTWARLDAGQPGGETGDIENDVPIRRQRHIKRDQCQKQIGKAQIAGNKSGCSPGLHRNREHLLPVSIPD
jgi:hypothetical protein